MTTKEKAQNLMQIDDNNNPQFATLHPNLLIGIYQAFEIMGLQEVVWVNCGGKSSVCRVKNDVSWVARN